MNRVNKTISFVCCSIKETVWCAIMTMVKIISILYNSIIKKRWLKILFVIILPFIINLFLVTYFERGICSFELPIASHQDKLIVCSKALSGVDLLSRINPDLASLLRYDFSIKNNWRAVDNSENPSTSTLNFLVKDEITGNEKIIPAGKSYIIEGSLSYSEVIDRLRNYTPIVELPKSGGMNEGGWELNYKPDIFSATIQFFIILIAWFQLMEICIFLKE